MIKSFADRETGALFYGRKRKAARPVPERLAEKARAKLNLVDAATELEELRRPPGNRRVSASRAAMPTM